MFPVSGTIFFRTNRVQLCAIRTNGNCTCNLRALHPRPVPLPDASRHVFAHHAARRYKKGHAPNCPRVPRKIDVDATITLAVVLQVNYIAFIEIDLFGGEVLFMESDFRVCEVSLITKLRGYICRSKVFNERQGCINGGEVLWIHCKLYACFWSKLSNE